MLYLLFLIHSLSAQFCPQYECVTKSYPSSDESDCLVANPQTGVLYPRPCKWGYQCLKQGLSHSCQKSSTYTPGTKVAGTFCSYDQDCVKNNICIYHKCIGLPYLHPCTSHLDCDVGLYCSPSNSTCVPQLKIGQTGCVDDSYCVNNAGCQTYSKTDPSLNICTKYFSLDDYHAMVGCSVSGEINYLCESGYCIDVGVSVCYPAPTLGNKQPVQCLINADCVSTQTGQFKLVIQSECLCGLNEKGFGYCSLLPGDKVYDEYDEMIREWVESKGIEKCNTYGRFGSGCMETHWGKKRSKEFGYKEFRAMNFSMVYGSEECALETLAPGYAAVMDYESDSWGVWSFGGAIIFALN